MILMIQLSTDQVSCSSMTSHVVLPSAPRKDEVRSKHSRIEIPTERLGSATIAKVSSGFDCKRVEDNLAMSVQQCLACNAVVPKSSKSCQCGHVFEDVKQIAGKRFSEYRAELYWRLESKRMKALSKENTPLNEVTPTDENNNVNKDVKDNNNNEQKIAEPIVQLSAVPKKRILQRRVKGLCPTNRGLHKPSNMNYQRVQSTNDKSVSPEVLYRLSKALEEINKKILTQNMVWKSLV
nr:uncharacterized protein LOC131786077 isoform X1 [Pocillopora verrucosa]